MATAVRPRERRYVFEGREVTLPVTVRDACSGAATYLVSARAARRLLPGPELDVVELLPGRALFSVACIDYRDNDLGAYTYGVQASQFDNRTHCSVEQNAAPITLLVNVKTAKD